MKYFDIGTKTIPSEFILVEDYHNILKGTHYVVSMSGHNVIMEKRNGESPIAVGVIFSREFLNTAQIEPCTLEKYLKLKAFI